MHWTEPATSDDSHSELEKQLWNSANQLWANAALKPSEYSPTVLGLVFLRYADVKFAVVEAGLKPQPGSRRKTGPADYHAAGVIYLPDEARFAHLLSLPEGANTGQAVNEAMRSIEKENPDLADVLPKTYHILDSRTLAELLKVMASIPMDKGGIRSRDIPVHDDLGKSGRECPYSQRVADTLRLTSLNLNASRGVIIREINTHRSPADFFVGSNRPSKKGGMPKTNDATFEAFPVPVPPPEEKFQISRRLSTALRHAGCDHPSRNFESTLIILLSCGNQYGQNLQF